MDNTPRKDNNGVTVSVQANSMVIEMGRAPNKSQIERITKVVSSVTKTKSDKDELSKRDEIEKFLQKYSMSKSMSKSDIVKVIESVPVRDLRHIIPMLLMEVYSDIYGAFSKKVKGLWEKRPLDWPESVYFVDPNNKLKTREGVGTKPKKEILNSMITYLIRRYLRDDLSEEDEAVLLIPSSDPFISQAAELDHFPIISSDDQNLLFLEETDSRGYKPLHGSSESYSGYPSGDNRSSSHPSASSLGNSSFRLASEEYQDVTTFLLQKERLDFPDVFCGNAGAYSSGGALTSASSSYVSAPLPSSSRRDRSPEQVQDDGAKDWNPVADLRARLEAKLNYLRECGGVDVGFLTTLKDIRDLIFGSSSEFNVDREMMMLERGYRLEFFIDAAKHYQVHQYPENFSLKLAEFQGELTGRNSNSNNMKLDKTPVSVNESGRGILSDDGRGMLKIMFPTENMDETVLKFLNIAPRNPPDGGFAGQGQAPVEVRRTAEATAVDARIGGSCAGIPSADRCRPVSEEDDDVASTKSEVETSPKTMDVNDTGENAESDFKILTIEDVENVLMDLDWKNSAPVQEIGDDEGSVRSRTGRPDDDDPMIGEPVDVDDDESPKTEWSTKAGAFVCALASPSDDLSYDIGGLKISNESVVGSFDACRRDRPTMTTTRGELKEEKAVPANVRDEIQTSTIGDVNLPVGYDTCPSTVGFAKPGVVCTYPVQAFSGCGVLSDGKIKPAALPSNPATAAPLVDQGAATSDRKTDPVVLSVAQFIQLMKSSNPGFSFDRLIPSINPDFMRQASTTSSLDVLAFLKRFSASPAVPVERLLKSVDRQGGATPQQTPIRSIDRATYETSCRQPILEKVMRSTPIIAEKRKFVSENIKNENSSSKTPTSESGGQFSNVLIPVMVAAMDDSESDYKPAVKKLRPTNKWK